MDVACDSEQVLHQVRVGPTEMCKLKFREIARGAAGTAPELRRGPVSIGGTEDFDGSLEVAWGMGEEDRTAGEKQNLVWGDTIIKGLGERIDGER